MFKKVIYIISFIISAHASLKLNDEMCLNERFNFPILLDSELFIQQYPDLVTIYSEKTIKEFLEKYKRSYDGFILQNRMDYFETTKYVKCNGIALDDPESFYNFVLSAHYRLHSCGITDLEMLIANILKPREPKHGFCEALKDYFLCNDLYYRDLENKEIIDKWWDIKTAIRNKKYKRITNEEETIMHDKQGKKD